MNIFHCIKFDDPQIGMPSVNIYYVIKKSRYAECRSHVFSKSDILLYRVSYVNILFCTFCAPGERFLYFARYVDTFIYQLRRNIYIYIYIYVWGNVNFFLLVHIFLYIFAKKSFFFTFFQKWFLLLLEGRIIHHNIAHILARTLPDFCFNAYVSVILSFIFCTFFVSAVCFFLTKT